MLITFYGRFKGGGGVKNRRPFATTLKCRAWNGFFKGGSDWLEGGADMWTKPLGHHRRVHQGTDHWRHFVLRASTKNKPKIHELCVSIKMQIATKVKGGVMHSGRGYRGRLSVSFTLCLLVCLFVSRLFFGSWAVWRPVAILWAFHLHERNVGRCLP